jgi:hypothetical protein
MNEGIFLTDEEAKLAIAYLAYVLYFEFFDQIAFSSEDREGLQNLIKKLNEGAKMPHKGGKYEVN